MDNILACVAGGPEFAFRMIPHKAD